VCLVLIRLIIEAYLARFQGSEASWLGEIHADKSQQMSKPILGMQQRKCKLMTSKPL
jgi:hypothetical protein